LTVAEKETKKKEGGMYSGLSFFLVVVVGL
jgi:hypothetical protein